jgi:general secretion pathway protein G
MMKTKQSGFTLVEILIVVVILGILAAIVIPQFTSASTEAKTSRLVSDLQSMRSQIQLYKIQHNDALPGTATTGETFAQAITGYTLQDGSAASPQAPAPGVFGPYMQALPTNPFVPDATKANVVTVGAGSAVGDNSSGWYFNSTTGVFQANDNYDGNNDGTPDHIGL